jgi:hypothetical protein
VIVPPPDSKNDADKPAGRVRHDSSGRAIWEWAAESGRHALDSTSLLLKRLDLPGLTLASDEKPKQDPDAAAELAHDDGKPVGPAPGGKPAIDASGNNKRGFNPYDTRMAARQPVRKTPSRPAKAPSKPAKKPGFLARLFGRK